ncbi:RNA 2',3'-cyclic phosphodiesterase [Coralloluteibacterium thermophilus]|uniref:RNA 2',3'-cyclic phosphodiesterase n=1 Tax=Coralloluteibacterium thermophilum TaxID=2707049 RepID=A0ABV9NPX6_9GAMM
MSGPVQGGLFGDPAQDAGGEVHRLFFALWPDEDVRAAMAARAADLRARHPARARWVGAHRYHLTLCFLGDRPVLDVPVLERASAAAAALAPSGFDLVLDRAGSFANRSIPWWLGCSATPPGLVALHDALASALVRAGVRLHPPTRLVPHVTVARDAAEPLDAPVAPLAWRVDRFVLIHSVLGPRSQYRIVGEWPLA